MLSRSRITSALSTSAPSRLRRVKNVSRFAISGSILLGVL